MNIALTGNIGSGKSGVAAMLANCLDADIVNTDVLCRELLLPYSAGWADLRHKWSDTFFNSDGELDRTLLRSAVFKDDTVRLELEAILHPLVLQEVEYRLSESKEQGRDLIVEVPLLFEVGWYKEFEHTVAIYAPANICIARTVIRDKVSQAQARRILEVQMSPEEKARRADSVIDNSGLWIQTALQVAYLARKLRSHARE